jgi:hypothetical protein
MPVPFDPTMTLTDGVTTITWNARPSIMRYDPQMNVVVSPLPLSNQSRVQPMGHGGMHISWEGVIYFGASPVINTHVTMTGAVNAQDIIQQLRIWARAGTTLTYTDDEILEYNSGSPISVKIIEFTYPRMPGHPYDYEYRIALQEYDLGAAI